MIRSNKNIIYLLISLFTCVACTNETLVGPTVEEDVPVTATLSFQTTNPVKIETRATDISQKNKVNSLAIFIFKTNGNKVGDTHICTQEELKEGGKISIYTTSGTRYIYAIANYENSLFNLNADDDLEKISSIEDLKRLSSKLLQESISVLDGEFLMSGCVVPDEETYDYTSDKTTCTISTSGVVNGKIQLKHVMAAVRFKVACTKDGATFIPSSWQIKKLPLRTNVFEHEEDSEGMYFNSKSSTVFENEAGGYRTFSFLMLENRKDMKNSGVEVDTYDKREMMDDSYNEPEHFKVANDNSTYVVLKGTYEGTTDQTVNGDTDDKFVKASTTFYIHLGMWKEKGKIDYTNFDIFRNNRYTYTVDVTGVNNLVVEVEKAGEENETWGSDGDLFLSSQRVETFDAHYGTTNISFSKKMIADLRKKFGKDGTADGCSLEEFKDNFKILASTPRSNFQSDGSDINWVTYKKNTGTPNEYMKYEGGLDVDHLLLSADKFKEDLYDAYSELQNDDDKVYYTCFIDEYFYGDTDGNRDSNVGLPLKYFINTQPRTIQICTYYNKNDVSSSTSTINMAAYTFSQQPICTVYDLDYLDKGTNGWGIEWTQESENLKAFGFVMQNGFNLDYENITTYGKGENEPGKNYYDQGRKNITSLLAEKSDWNWDTYIDFKSNSLTTQFNYADYACLSRNRDLNGNGVIDENELRWYLPAIKQYIGLAVGDNVLPKDARLYNEGAEGADDDYTYLSSSIYKYEPYVLKSSEVASLELGQEKDRQYPYRCVRNLVNVTTDTDEFVTKSDEYYPDTACKFYSFEKLNDGAKRDNISGSLTFDHNYFEEENRLPNSFEVGEWEDDNINALKASLGNPCKGAKEGWRLPNQRELLIIVFNRAEDSGIDIENAYFSCTKAFGKDLYCGYDCFLKSMVLWKGDATIVVNHNPETQWSPTEQKIKYRCVKDKK